jgi:hypothetical protein
LLTALFSPCSLRRAPNTTSETARWNRFSAGNGPTRQIGESWERCESCWIVSVICRPLFTVFWDDGQYLPLRTSWINDFWRNMQPPRCIVKHSRCIFRTYKPSCLAAVTA